MTRRRQTRRHDDDATPLDVLRQVFVTLAALVMLLGALSGSGILAKVPVLKDIPWLRGVPVDRAAGGWLAPGTTLLSPSRPAFAIWGVIYLGLIAYTVWQWRGSRGDDPRYRGSGWWIGLAMLATGAWIFVTQAGMLWPAVAVLAAVVAFSFVGVMELSGHSTARTFGTRLMTDVGPGLLLGWSTIALAANIFSAAGSSGIRPGGWPGTIAALAAMVVVLVLSGTYIRFLGPRLSVAAGIVWGLAWIAWARLMEHPRAYIVGWGGVGVAIMVAFLTIGALIHVSAD